MLKKWFFMANSLVPVVPIIFVIVIIMIFCLPSHSCGHNCFNGYSWCVCTLPWTYACFLLPFGVYTHLKHGADFAASVRELSLKGFGNRCELPESNEWPEPQPVVASTDPAPYPIDALPRRIRDAVIEVQKFNKAPISLVASSAMAALSLAIQAHVDVKRTENLIGPSSLFILSIADSGERKSTCDNYFTHAIRQYEKEQLDLAYPELKNFRADLDAWTAKKNGLLEAISKPI
jgi:hypothetical protein